jgi:branched-chain amino acid transport system ATP-binding protein
MNPYKAAKAGISRTFQNIALFKGMNVIDNLMTGRNLKMKQQPDPAGVLVGAGAARGTGASRQG